jgi:RecG-like helicase
VAQLAVGTRVRCYGTPRPGQSGLEIVHPSYQVVDDDEAAVLGGTLDPVYPEIEGLGPLTQRRLIAQAWHCCRPTMRWSCCRPTCWPGSACPRCAHRC